MDEALRRTINFQDQCTGNDLADHRQCLDVLKDGLRTVLHKALRKSGGAGVVRNAQDAEECLAFIERTLRGQTCLYGGQIFSLRGTCIVQFALLKLLPEPEFEGASGALIGTSAQLLEQLGRVDFELLRSFLGDCAEALKGVRKRPLRLQAFQQFEHGFMQAISDETSKPTAMHGVRFELATPPRLAAFCSRLLGLVSSLICAPSLVAGWELENLWLAALELTADVVGWGVTGGSSDASGMAGIICSCLKCILCLLLRNTSAVDADFAAADEPCIVGPSVQVQWKLLDILPGVASAAVQKADEAVVQLLCNIAVHVVSSFDEALLFPQLADLLRPFSSERLSAACLRVLIATAGRFAGIGMPAESLWRSPTEGTDAALAPLQDNCIHAALAEALRLLNAHVALCTHALSAVEERIQANTDLERPLLLLSLAVRSLPAALPDDVSQASICTQARSRFLQVLHRLFEHPEATTRHLGLLEIVLGTVLGDSEIALDPGPTAQQFLLRLRQVLVDGARPSPGIWRVFVLALEAFTWPSKYSLTVRWQLVSTVAIGCPKRFAGVECAGWLAIGRMLSRFLEGAVAGARNQQHSQKDLELLYQHLFRAWVSASSGQSIHGDPAGKAGATNAVPPHSSVVAALAYVFPLIVTFAATLRGLVQQGDPSQMPRLPHACDLSQTSSQSGKFGHVPSPCRSSPNPLRVKLAATPTACQPQAMPGRSDHQMGCNRTPLPTPCPFCGKPAPLPQPMTTAAKGLNSVLGEVCGGCGLNILCLEWRIFWAEAKDDSTGISMTDNRSGLRLLWAWSILRQGESSSASDGSSGAMPARWLQSSRELLEACSGLFRTVWSSPGRKSAFDLLEPSEDTQSRGSGLALTAACAGEVTWLLGCGLFAVCVLSSRQQLFANATLLKGLLQQFLSRCASAKGSGWEQDTIAELVLALLRSNSFVSAILHGDSAVAGTGQEARPRETFEMQLQCHRWRLEVLGVSASNDMAAAADPIMDLGPATIRAICDGSPRAAATSQLSVLVAGAAATGKHRRCGKGADSPSHSLQRLLAFGMLSGDSMEDIFASLEDDAYIRLFENYSASNFRVDGLCRLLFRKPLKKHVLVLLPRILPAMVLRARMCTIQELCSLLEESAESLFTPQLPFILSSIAQESVQAVTSAFHFMLERVFLNQMTITHISDASLGKLLVLILWKNASGAVQTESSTDANDRHAIAKSGALTTIDHIVKALRAYPSGAGQITEATPTRKRKLSDWASPPQKRQTGWKSGDGVINVPLGEELSVASPEVVQCLEENFLHVLDILEIVLSGRRHFPKYAEYSPLLSDESGGGTMDFGRLFSAVSLLFHMVPGSLHRFAAKILEFLQSATALSDCHPESAHCWHYYVASVEVQRLQPLLPAVVGELLRLAARLRKQSPATYRKLCENTLRSLVESACRLHADVVASLPSLPPWPELSAARTAVEKAQGPRQTEGFAARLESGIARMEAATQQSAKNATLRHLMDLVSAQRSESPRAIVELPAAVLARLMRALLTFLWESSAWPADQLKCGELLGAVGAIDPSRFPHMEIVSSSRSARTPEDVGNMEVLARRVLAEFLVPSITSENAYAFSAQEILKYLKFSGKLNIVFNSLKDDVQQTLKPYLQSSYKLIEPGDSQGLSAFEGVVAHAASLVQGEQRTFFEACLPAAHGNHGLALFLMHHVLHYLLHSNTAVADLQKLSRSLAHLLDSPQHSTAQAVFALVDDMTKRREDFQWRLPTYQKPADITATKQRIQRIDEVLKCVTHRKVVAASVRCGAHARALQFLERALIDERTDWTNVFDKPRIEKEEDCLLLQSIYSQLQQPDGVLGALRVGPSTSRTRTLQLEQTGRWHDVLSCYEEQLGTSESLGASLERRRDLLCGLVRCNQNMRRFQASLQLIHGMETEEDVNLHPRLRPLAVEASWQLSRWDGLSAVLEKAQGDRLRADKGDQPEAGTVHAIDEEFQLGLGQALLALHGRKRDSLASMLQKTTLDVTRKVASTARESYQRAYRHLLKLHVLADLGWLSEKALTPDNSGALAAASSPTASFAKNLLERTAVTVPTFAARQLILSPLQVAMRDLGLVEDAKHLELEFVRLCRKHRAQVPIAMEHPTTSFCTVSPSLLSRAQLEWGKLLYMRGSRHEALQHMQELGSRDPKARLLGARWATENSSELLIPRVAEAEFLHVKEQLPEDEKAWFYHASYLDQLLKEQLISKAAANESSAARVLRRTGSTSVCPFDLKSLVTFTLRGYLQALHRGNKRLHFILSRVLQLAWDCCELNLHKVEALTEIEAQSATMQPWMWYVVLTQLISRVHNLDMRKVFTNLIMTVVLAFPRQSGWQMIQLLKSTNKDHEALGHEMVLQVSRKDRNIHALLTRYYRVCEILISLANHAPPDGVTTMNLRQAGQPFLKLLGEKAPKDAWSLLVPLQSQMTADIPRMRNQRETKSPIDPFRDQVCTSRCIEEVDVFRTKEKPKKVTFVGSDGRLYPFLCKAEKRGDLRKDSRMMEVGVMVNQLLQKNPDTRRRNLEIRTFNVVIFTESTGLIEWVPNTKGMRNIVDELWRHLRPGQQQSLREVKELVDKSKNLYDTFTKQILPRHPPVLHHWFSRGMDPSAWLSRRLTFTRSQASWCMLGYILGLGDRHGENILVDTESGRMVHVDFDCIFGKGMLLERPETVPFRLTQNCVAAMGITGVEGAFRKSCELFMQVVRDRANQQTLLSVLHVFIADPLIEWASRSRQDPQREEQRIQQARTTIGDVEKKLNGMLNVGAVVRGVGPRLERESVMSMEERSRSLLGRDRGVGLSVEGQVDELLKAAMCKYNLSEMYVGWQPWL